MSKKRKYPAADEKALILKRYLAEKVPLSDICDEYELQPSQIYRWQKQLFENAAAAFRRRTGGIQADAYCSRPRQQVYDAVLFDFGM